MIFLANDGDYYKQIDEEVKQRAREFPDREDLEGRFRYAYAPTEHFTCQERMEFSYWRMELYTRQEYPLLEIVMSLEWYKKCYEEFGRAFTHWNHLKVYIDQDSPFDFTFRAGDQDD